MAYLVLFLETKITIKTNQLINLIRVENKLLIDDSLISMPTPIDM